MREKLICSEDHVKVLLKGEDGGTEGGEIYLYKVASPVSLLKVAEINDSPWAIHLLVDKTTTKT